MRANDERRIEMKNRGLMLWCLAIGGAIGLNLVLGGALSAAPEDPGQTAFMGQKCNTCHSVSSAGIEKTTKSEKMAGPDLKGVVAEKGADWTKKWIMKEVEVDGKKHSKEYKGTPEELDAMIKWLEGQK
jgi:cytochrome c2